MSRISGADRFFQTNVAPEVTRVQVLFQMNGTGVPILHPSGGTPHTKRFVDSVVRSGVGVFAITFKGSAQKVMSFGASTTDPDLAATVTTPAAPACVVTVHDRASPAVAPADDASAVVSVWLDLSDTGLPT